MNRWLATFQTDLRLQFRNGFYVASAFVAVFAVLVLLQIPDAYQRSALPVILPFMLVQNLAANAFYFIGALVLLEKDQGTLQAQVVTPLRQEEYLSAKVLSLIGLSVLESSLIFGLVYGRTINWLPMLLAIITMAALLALYGFLIVVRYDSINSYLLPSVAYLMVFSLPLLDVLGVWRSPLLYLHPLQASFVLLRGAYTPLPFWGWAYGLLYSGLWIGLLFWLCRRAYSRFVRGKA